MPEFSGQGPHQTNVVAETWARPTFRPCGVETYLFRCAFF